MKIKTRIALVRGGCCISLIRNSYLPKQVLIQLLLPIAMLYKKFCEGSAQKHLPSLHIIGIPLSAVIWQKCLNDILIFELLRIISCLRVTNNEENPFISSLNIIMNKAKTLIQLAFNSVVHNRPKYSKILKKIVFWLFTKKSVISIHF